MDLSHGGHLTHGHPAVVLRPRVQGRGVRRAPRGRAHRLRGARAARAGASAEADHRRGVRLRAGDRLREVRRGRRRGRRRAHVRHRAHRGPGHRRAPQLSRPARTVRDDDDAQDAARAARRPRAVPRRAREGPRPHACSRASRAARSSTSSPRRRSRSPRRRRRSSSTYQRRIVENAKALAAALIARGFRLVSGGTDNHMLLLDVGARGITGKEAEKLLDSVGLTVNKNTIPFDSRPPMVASGIRIGTPAVTTRGMGVAEMELIGDADRADPRRARGRRGARGRPADGRRALRGVPAAGVTPRPAHAAAAAAVLAASLIASDPPKDLARRIRSLSHYAPQGLAVRRLGGSSTDFDRRYFILLEWARLRMPDGRRGPRRLPRRRAAGPRRVPDDLRVRAPPDARRPGPRPRRVAGPRLRAPPARGMARHPGAAGRRALRSEPESESEPRRRRREPPPPAPAPRGGAPRRGGGRRSRRGAVGAGRREDAPDVARARGVGDGRRAGPRRRLRPARSPPRPAGMDPVPRPRRRGGRGEPSASRPPGVACLRRRPVSTRGAGRTAAALLSVIALGLGAVRGPRADRADVVERLPRDLGPQGQDHLRALRRSAAAGLGPVAGVLASRVPARNPVPVRRPRLPRRRVGRPRRGGALPAHPGGDAARARGLAAPARRSAPGRALRRRGARSRPAALHRVARRTRGHSAVVLRAASRDVALGRRRRDRLGRDRAPRARLGARGRDEERGPLPRRGGARRRIMSRRGRRASRASEAGRRSPARPARSPSCLPASRRVRRPTGSGAAPRRSGTSTSASSRPRGGASSPPGWSRPPARRRSTSCSRPWRSSRRSPSSSRSDAALRGPTVSSRSPPAPPPRTLPAVARPLSGPSRDGPALPRPDRGRRARSRPSGRSSRRVSPGVSARSSRRPRQPRRCIQRIHATSHSVWIASRTTRTLDSGELNHRTGTSAIAMPRRRAR